MLTFQQIIHTLLKFWSDKGCTLHQGYDVETGAGTFNPSTFLRSLGPEPYSAVYVEPSRRPTDGRYGENPNRTQLFHQLQVIMKPSPVDIQKLYLDSLEAIGFNLSKHDIRFVHDDWESPTQGAWGLGWEVWMDGMEVTQFTYFQQVGGQSLNPVAVELTYGLERLCMHVQKVNNFFDMKYSDELTYGDVYHESEVEWSRYNFDESDSAMWKSHFDDFEKEAKRLFERDLPLPAYDFVMKASHAFNMLEARGVISVTERTGYIHRVRTLSCAVAKSYLEKRESDGFPLLKTDSPHEEVYEPKLPKNFDPTKQRDFLLEIGSEQLPATFVPIGMRHLKAAVLKLLQENTLSHGEVAVYGSPRRLTIHIKDLASGLEDKTVEKRGPPADTAYDAEGALTKQGLGFLRSLDLTPEDVEVRDGYLYAQKVVAGQSTLQILSENLPPLIENLSFPKKMRWAETTLSYARPIHWILALFGDDIVPFKCGPIISDRRTHGHAQLSPKALNIKEPEDYLPKLKKQNVLADPAERLQSIKEQLEAIENETDSLALAQNRVLPEVLHLSENPQLTHSTFDEKFLDAPDDVLISEMVNHQRYFPLADKNGTLKNLFVITADNNPSDLIRENNMRVLAARLADGLFLYNQDLKKPLEDLNEKLKTITFQKDLGSVYDKVKRLTEIAPLLSQKLGLSTAEKTKRAALLSKADLASELVGEFPELQGIIGRHYAQDEDPDVSLAIEEHYFPKTEGDPLPSTETGLILSLADKIDNLIGYFSVDLKPTSSSDPYAIRRQTIGLLKILIENKISTDLKMLLEESALIFPKLKGHPHNQRTLVDDLLTYLTTRAKSVFEDYGFRNDEIEASLSGLCLDPYDQYCKVRALSEFRTHSDFAKLFEVYKRARGQLENQPPFTLNPKLFEKNEEKALHIKLDDMSAEWKVSQDARDYKSAFSLLATLKSPLADLFDNVKILAEDPKIKENRLALLQTVFAHFDALLDFSKIQL